MAVMTGNYERQILLDNENQDSGDNHLKTAFKMSPKSLKITTNWKER